jgi:hypothetical protein
MRRLGAAELLLAIRRRSIAQRSHEALRVESGDPLQGCGLHVIEAFPRPPPMYHLRLVQPNDGLGERIVIRIARAADVRCGGRIGRAVGVAHPDLL